MDFGIEGKVALVTGATKGIGLGIAQALAREGARVSVVARTEADVKRVADEIDGFGVAADVLTEDGCKRSVEETEAKLGPIDILVNNFGARAGSSWSDTGPKEFERAFEGNVIVTSDFAIELESNDNTIQGNLIGTNATGTAGLGAGRGIVIVNSNVLSANNTSDVANLRQNSISLSPTQAGAPVFPNILAAAVPAVTTWTFERITFDVVSVC